MNDNLTNKLVELTDEDKDEIVNKLELLTITNLYHIIDVLNSGDDDKLLNIFNSLTGITEAMQKKTSVKGKLPKPRDPIAKALELLQNQPKTTPNKKTQLSKAENKHKGRTGEDAGASFSSVAESVSFSNMQGIARMLELAGRPVQDTKVKSAMEDAFLPPDLPDFSRFGIHATPINTKLVPGLVQLDVQDFDDLILADIDAQSEILQNITSAFGTVLTLLQDLPVSEIAAFKALLDNLISEVDQVTGRL